MTVPLPRPEAVQAVLDDAYSAGVVEDEHGKQRRIAPTGVGAKQAAALRDLVAFERPSRTVETGFGFGLSAAHITVGMLAAGASDPHHVAIDPSERQAWGNAGSRLVERAGLGAIVELVEEESQLALARFVGEGRTFDLAFVDGDHRFDPAFVDIYFLTRLVRPGGLILVDDMWMPAVRVAVSFFERNIGMELLPDAMPGAFRWTRRRARRVPHGRGHTAVLRMPPHHVARPWDHFVPFA